MYHIKDDKRSIRSSEMLYEGLAKLTREKDYDAITVTELVEAARVGRTTFYRNFDTIDDVLRMRCDQVIAGMVRYLQEYRRTQAHDLRTSLLRPVLRYFYLHSDLIELLIAAKRIDLFQEAFQGALEPARSVFSTLYDIEEEYVDYVLAMRVGAVISVLLRWVETGKRQAPDDLADRLNAMLNGEATLYELL